MKLTFASAFVLLVGCSSSSHSTDMSPSADLAPPDAAESGDMSASEPGAGVDTTVNIFTNQLFAFDSTGNTREHTATVVLPTAGTYAKITLHVQLTGPSKGCDPYDRVATLGVVQPGNND